MGQPANLAQIVAARYELATGDNDKLKTVHYPSAREKAECPAQERGERTRGTNRRPHLVISAFVLWLAVALHATSQLFATTVVALRDAKHNRVVIATDSRVHYRYTPAESWCKIYAVTSDCLFTMSGLYEFQSPPFRLFSFGDSACRGTGDLKQRADAFLAAVFPKITEVAKYLAKTDPTYLRDNYEGKPIIEVLFIGIYNGQASIFARGAVLKNGMLRMEKDDAISDDEGFFSGVNAEIVTYINSHHGTWNKRGPIG